jgi:glycine cleavage system regulatory protein
MQIPIVMTVISPDRTGLVESIARTVAEHGGNWLESRLCRLGGEFTGILRVDIDAEKKSALLSALQKLQTNGLQIIIRETAAAAVSGRQTKLEIVGDDRPGIVREITSTLARAGVNVEEFSSEVVSAPESGESLFKAAAYLRLPDKCDLASLKKELEKIAGELQVDVSFAELAAK